MSNVAGVLRLTQFPIICVLLCSCSRELGRLVAVSPDGRWECSAVSRSEGIDRKVEVVLRDLGAGTTQCVFRSPDEGRPVGSEGLAWSPDSRYVLLTGRHFYVVAGATGTAGEAFYLLCDASTRKVWCNSRQTEVFPRFSGDKVRQAFGLKAPPF